METKSIITNLKFIVVAAVALVCVTSCEKKHSATQKKSSARPAEAGAVVSAEKNSFDDVTAKLDKGGQVFLYLSTEQWTENLSAKVSDWRELFNNLPNNSEKDRASIDRALGVVTDVIKNSGLEKVSGVGMSSVAREPGFYYSKMILHHYPGPADGYLWSMFGKETHQLDGLDLLPEKTALAVFSDFNTPLLWSELKKEIAQLGIPEVAKQFDQLPEQFKKQTGLDLDKVIESFGGEYGLVLTLDDDKKISFPAGKEPIEFPAPALAIVAKVKNDMVFDHVDKLLKGNRSLISEDKGGLKMRTIPLPVPLPIEFRPTLARSGDYLIFASSDALVREIVAVKGGKKGWKSTDQFKRLAQGVPLEGNSFFFVSDSISKAIREIQEKVMTANGKINPALTPFIQKLHSGATPSMGFTVGANTDEGWIGIGNGTRSLNGAVLAPALAAPVGLLAAIAIPNFVKARTTAQMNAMMNNLRMLDGAKEQWALENRKQTGSDVSDADIAPYLRNRKINPVIGEEYILNPIGTAPQVKLKEALQGHPAGSLISADELMNARPGRARTK